jgi:hypothetical protein
MIFSAGIEIDLIRSPNGGHDTAVLDAYGPPHRVQFVLTIDLISKECEAILIERVTEREESHLL